MSKIEQQERKDFDTRSKINDIVFPLEVALNMEFSQPHIKSDPAKQAEYSKLTDMVKSLKDLIISGQLPSEDQLDLLRKGIQDLTIQ